MTGRMAELVGDTLSIKQLGVDLPNSHELNHASSHRRHLSKFWQLIRHYHARSGKTCAVAANLAGISSSYLYDILNGRRWRMSWQSLRALCEDGWQLTESEGKQLLWLRCLADGSFKQRAYLTREFIWQVAAYTHQHIANDIGLDDSYLARILAGRHRPTIEVLMLLYAYVGLDTSQAARLYAQDVHREFVGSM